MARKLSSQVQRRDMRRVLRGPERLEPRILLSAVSGFDQFAVDLENSPDQLWQWVEEQPAPFAEAQNYIQPDRFESVTLNAELLRSTLSTAPLEYSAGASSESLVIDLPTPDGGFDRFEIVESPIMAPELAARFPDIKTYAGQGIDDPAASVRFDITPQGFHSQVLSPNGAYYIDPYWHLDDSLYISYFKRDYSSRPSEFVFHDHQSAHSLETTSTLAALKSSNSFTSLSTSNLTSGGELRTYDLANAATGEYTSFHGGTVAAGQAAIVTAINRVTGIYEVELATRFRLVGNNDQLVYTNSSTDPYTNGNASMLLTENQFNVDTVIGDAFYDVGHVFSTGGGGLAALGVVGVSGLKAQGETGLTSPIGDPFYVDFVAHELGHQFNGNHTFNGDSGNCSGGNRNASTAYEPGSGSTIQAYAGICDNDNLQPNSDPYFHSISFDEMFGFVTGAANSAADISLTGNNAPSVSAGLDYTISARTNFALTAAGSDPDSGDVLTYNWEQRDLGPQQDVNAGDNGSSPLFRSFNATTSPTRSFQRLPDLLNNTTVIGETLPTTTRTMNFRVTVRDNASGGGGVNSDDMVLNVVDTGSPFRVSSPNTAVTWTGGTTQTVTWDVAGTDANGINTSQVNILLSTDGGNTFTTTILAGTANDGTEAITVPNTATSNARLKVEGAGNVFFDISDADFTIVPGGPGVNVAESGGSTDVSEAGATDTYDIALQTTPAGAVEITVNADSQSEVSLNGTSFSSSVVFSRNNTTIQTITVRAIDDGVNEGGHTNTITHQITDSADPSNYPTSLNISDVTVNITDNDVPGVVVTPTGGSTEITEGGATDSYDLALITAPAGAVEVTINADSQGQVSLDGSSFSSSVVFSLSDTTPQTITVRAVDDATSEGLHSSTISHAITDTGDATNYPTSLPIDDLVATVTDNDAVILVGVDFDTATGTSPNNWTPVNAYSVPHVVNDLVDESGNTTPFDLTLTGSNSNHFAATVNASTLPVHDQSLTGIDGQIYTSLQSVTAVWSDLNSSAEYEIYVFGLESFTGFLDDQTVTITGDGTAVQFTQLLSNGNLYVNGEVGDSTRSLQSYAHVVSPDGNDQITISVTANDGSADLVLGGLAIREVAATTPGVTVSETNSSTDISEAGSTDTYNIALATAPAGAAEITVTADIQSLVSLDGASFASSVNFTRNDTAVQTITVKAVNDAADEGNHTSTISHAITATADATDYPTSLGINDVTANIIDDDVPLAANAFVRLEPLGGFIFASQGNSGIIGQAGDFDDFSFFAESGQTIAAVATPVEAGVKLSVSLDGVSNVIEAATPGQAVVLPATPSTVDGTFHVHVSGDAPTVYTVDIYRNADLEAVIGDTADGNELALDGSLITLGSGRYGAVGSADGTGTDTDEYELNLVTGQTIDVIVDGHGGVDYSGQTLLLLGLDGTTVAAPGSNSPLGVAASNYDLGILGYSVTVAGTYTIRVTAAEGSYGLIVTESTVFETAPNGGLTDTFRSLNDVSSAVGHLGDDGGNALLHCLAGVSPVEHTANGGNVDATHDHMPATSYYIPRSTQMLRPGEYLSAPHTGDPWDIAIEFMQENAGQFGLTPSDLNDFAVTNMYVSERNGVTHIYLRQLHNGLPVVNADINVNVTAEGRVLNAASSFLPGLNATSPVAARAQPVISAPQALTALAADFGWKLDTAAAVRRAALGVDQETVLGASGVSLVDIPARMHYVPTRDGGVQLAWNLNLQTVDRNHWYDASVSAVSGEVIYNVDWIDHAQYNVLALPLEDPNSGPRTIETDPHHVAASPFGWHDTNGVAGAEFTDTRGNNVFAQEDTDANNTGGSRPSGGAALDFNFALDLGQAPSTYQDAAITNLFYWNNILHDVHALYGFGEAAGNFQEFNYTAQGAGGDPVQADAQDGEGFNNANFGTPPDGFDPRMQMFVFNVSTPNRDGDLDNGIIIHEYGHGISNRLTGGSANVGALNAIQSGGMGEGWSDWWSLMFTQVSADQQNDAYTIGTYVLGQNAQTGAGIRRHPYSFDMTVNPLTYNDFNSSNQVHDAGEIWASALWDLNWLLINKHGFESDIYNTASSAGNILALQLVMDGLKLQPANPSFLQGRDAILAADQAATGAANQTEIWTAFARRGMGFSANDGGGGTATSVSAAFDLPATSAGTVDFDAVAYEVGDTVSITVRDSDLPGGGPISVTVASNGGDNENVSLADLGAGVFGGTISTAGGTINSSDGTLQVASGNLITVTYNDADDGTGSPATRNDTASIVQFSNIFVGDFSDTSGNPSTDGFTIDNTGAAVPGLWHLSTGRGNDAGHSSDDSLYFGIGEEASGGGTYDVGDTAGRITSPTISLEGLLDANLVFNHLLDTETSSSFDLAKVQISQNGGSFTDLPVNLLDTANSFAEVTISLTSYVDSDVRVRFDFDTVDEQFNDNEGWYIDDVSIRGIANQSGPVVSSIQPAAGQTNELMINTIPVVFSEIISTASATNAGNYLFLEAGANGVFDGGAGDDVVIGLSPSFNGARQVDLAVVSPAAPLALGKYQLTIDGSNNGIVDVDGNPLNSTTGKGGGSDHVHEFDVEFSLASGGDLFSIDLQVGDKIVVTTGTLFDDGAATPTNTLDPQLLLLDPSDMLVTHDTNSLDGKNARLEHNVTTPGTYTIQVLAESGEGEYLLDVDFVQPAVVDRRIFYNESSFDGDAAASANDDNAIAPSPDELTAAGKDPALGKTALVPGETATFANYTSYSRGINGVIIDINNLADSTGLSLADFEFRVGNDNIFSGWTEAPAPINDIATDVRVGAGKDGSDRITILWADNAIQNEWLEVTVKADPDGDTTGLAADDVFYWGNALGESGNSPGDTFVNALDSGGVRDNPHNFLNRAPVEDEFDFNHDELVNALDSGLVRDNATNFLSDLNLITVPPPAAPRQTSDSNSAKSVATSAVSQIAIEPVDELGGDVVPIEIRLDEDQPPLTPRHATATFSASSVANVENVVSPLDFMSSVIAEDRHVVEQTPAPSLGINLSAAHSHIFMQFAANRMLEYEGIDSNASGAAVAPVVSGRRVASEAVFREIRAVDFAFSSLDGGPKLYSDNQSHPGSLTTVTGEPELLTTGGTFFAKTAFEPRGRYEISSILDDEALSMRHSWTWRRIAWLNGDTR